MAKTAGIIIIGNEVLSGKTQDTNSHYLSKELRALGTEAEFIREQISDVEGIVRNECWLEGERQGRAVDPKEMVIQERVADIILAGAGEEFRRRRQRQRRG